MTLELVYYVSFGSGDCSEDQWWDIELTPEEEEAYNKAIENGTPLYEVDELEEARRRAYKEIEKEEISNCMFYDEEYVKECLGEIEMDCDELNDLVAARDSYALAYFGLTDATDEELSKWDAYELEEVPFVKDFDKNFLPCSPFDKGWSLSVSFVEPDEYDEEEEYEDEEFEDE